MSQRFDRRQFLASAAAALALDALPRRVRAGAPVPPAPVARIERVEDHYFGEVLTDPYRWMENEHDPQWHSYLRAQNAHARAILEALPERAALLERVRQLSAEVASTSRMQRAGGLVFYSMRPAGADNYKLLVRQGTQGAVRTLIDPTARRHTAGHLSLDWWKASPDGRYVVYGVSQNGSENSVLRVLRVADGADLAERIENTQDANPSWLDDGSGFFYNQLTGSLGSPQRFLDSRALFHRLNDAPRNDVLVMRRGLVPQIAYDSIQAPHILTFEGSKYAILVLSDVRQEVRAYIAPLALVLEGHAPWMPIADFEDVVTDIELDGEDLYLLANKGSPRGRVLKTLAARPQIAAAVEVVAQGAMVIENLLRARDALYLRLMDGGVNRLQRLRGNTLADILLPFEGTIDAMAVAADEEGALLSLGGWLTPTGIYALDAGGELTVTPIMPMPAIEVGGYRTQRSFAKAKDGANIPYTLIYRKDLKRDGSAPAYICAYGAYGLSAYTPAFVGRALALVDAGAIVGYANVRGGGEYGRAWHQAGQLANKPNTWRDLIAVCEALCEQHYTSPAHLAIGGRSAGGIAVGRAMTERPDLFAAVIDGVGWSNPLRYVAEQNGFGEEPEWGVIGELAGYRSLKAMDSYQAVKEHTPYPAVLLTTGVTDPRVAPFHAGKMAARLQAASSSGKPVLLRVDYDAGHGIGSTRTQQDAEAADTYAFLLWQLRS